MSDVEREIDAMKAALGVELDRDLANGLSIDPSAVAAWRRRGRVPEKYKIRYKIKNDERVLSDLIWLPAGRRNVYIFSLISTAAVLIDKSGYSLASPTETLDQALMAQKIGRFYSYLMQKFPLENDKVMLRQAYEKLRGDMLAADDILEWLDDQLPAAV